MTAPDATAPRRVAAYDYAAPTEADVVASLGRVFGPGRGVETWARACRAARVSPGAASTPDLLERCSQALASEGGAAATVARSVAIRLRTFNRLVASAAATTPEKSS